MAVGSGVVETTDSAPLDPFDVMDLWKDGLRVLQPPLTSKDYAIPVETIFSSLDDCIAHLDIAINTLRYQGNMKDEVINEDTPKRTNLVELCGQSKILSEDFTRIGFVLASRFETIVSLKDALSKEDTDVYLPYYRRLVTYILNDALLIASVLRERKAL